MKWLSITTCLILVLLVTGCDNMFRGFGLPPGDATIYKKPGVDIPGTEAVLDKCGNNTRHRQKDSPEVNMNRYIKVRYCMEDNGFTFPTDSGNSTARSICLNRMTYNKNKLPICVARGAYK